MQEPGDAWLGRCRNAPTGLTSCPTERFSPARQEAPDSTDRSVAARKGRHATETGAGALNRAGWAPLEVI